MFSTSVCCHFNNLEVAEPMTSISVMHLKVMPVLSWIYSIDTKILLLCYLGYWCWPNDNKRKMPNFNNTYVD